MPCGGIPGLNPGGGMPCGGIPGLNPGGGIPGTSPGGGLPVGAPENCGRMLAAEGPPTPTTGPCSPGAGAPPGMPRPAGRPAPGPAGARCACASTFGGGPPR